MRSIGTIMIVDSKLWIHNTIALTISTSEK